MEGTQSKQTYWTVVGDSNGKMVRGNPGMLDELNDIMQDSDTQSVG